MSRTRFIAALDKRDHINECESIGIIADSKEVRMELLRKVQTGELTPDEMLKELKTIKKNAKKEGKITREQAWREG